MGSCCLKRSLVSGLTCVVGPNGSGKSNLQEAILFASGSSLQVSLWLTQSTDVQETHKPRKFQKPHNIYVYDTTSFSTFAAPLQSITFAVYLQSAILWCLQGCTSFPLQQSPKDHRNNCLVATATAAGKANTLYSALCISSTSKICNSGCM